MDFESGLDLALSSATSMHFLNLQLLHFEFYHLESRYNIYHVALLGIEMVYGSAWHIIGIR